MRRQNSTSETVPEDGVRYMASFEDTSWGKGRTKRVYKGRIEGSGPRVGETVCVKIWRNTELKEDDCDLEIEKASKASEIAMIYNDFNHPGIKKIDVSVPLKAAMNTKASFHNLKIRERKLSKDEWVLIEKNIGKPFKGFQKRNGLTMKDGDQGTEAYMHFTYHQSQGNLVVCGLQGVSGRKSITISSPTIHSREKNYGEMDKGYVGIEEVFKNHICNDICKDWLKPDISGFIPPTIQGYETQRSVPSAPVDDDKKTFDGVDDVFVPSKP